MPDDLDVLAHVLTQADADRAADLTAVGGLDDAAADYLARVSELADPASDGLEADCA
jgi:hypothetical protein